jgi:hypothetical protein
MKKKTELVIKMSGTKRDLNVKEVSKTKKQILSDILREVNSALEHFNLEDGGWKLRKDYIQSEILRNIFGFSIEDEINQAFINEGLVIEYTNEGAAFVRTEEEYHPIYMSERTGELYVIENSDDNSYFKKFRESNGYVFIGRL